MCALRVEWGVRRVTPFLSFTLCLLIPTFRLLRSALCLPLPRARCCVAFSETPHTSRGARCRRLWAIAVDQLPSLAMAQQPVIMVTDRVSHQE